MFFLGMPWVRISNLLTYKLYYKDCMVGLVYVLVLVVAVGAY